MDGGPGTEDPGRITYRNVTLRNMLEAAYDLRSYQIIGPGWIDSQRFDVTATIPKGTSVEEFRVMLQALLRERLRMTVHHEQRPTRMYALVIAQGGLKMKESTEPDSQSSAPRRNPSATAQGMLHMGGVRSGIGSIAQLASRQLGDPVLDFTALKAGMTIHWTTRLQMAGYPSVLWGHRGRLLHRATTPITLISFERSRSS